MTVVLHPESHTDYPLNNEAAEYSRSTAVAEAMQERGIEYTYTPLDDRYYEGLYTLDQVPETWAEPTVRLYRGIDDLNASVLEQVGYASKKIAEDGTIQKTDDQELLAKIERFTEGPTYTNLRSYAESLMAGANEHDAETIARKLHEIENTILDGRSLSEGLLHAHVTSRVGVGDVNLSPYVSTSADPINAQRFGDGAVLVFDVPASRVHGRGEQDEVLVTGEVPASAVSAIVIKRHPGVRYGIENVLDQLPPPPSTDNTAYVERELATKGPVEVSAADVLAVSTVRAAQLWEQVPEDVRSGVHFPEPGPHAYRELQQKLFDFYMAAMPAMSGQPYTNQLGDKDYRYGTYIPVFDRRPEPYSRDKVTDGMIHELQREYAYALKAQLRRAQRLGNQAINSQHPSAK